MRFYLKKPVLISVMHSLKIENHKCAKPHGHSYRVTVEISAAKLDKNGFVCDLVEPIVKTFDQTVLNESIEPSTPAILCQALFDIFEMEITSAEMSRRDIRIESIVIEDVVTDEKFTYAR